MNEFSAVWNSTWERAIQIKKNKHIVARILGVCVGSLTYFYHSKDRVEILAMGVAHEHQNKGIGRSLVKKLTSKYLSVIVESDESSVGFYQKAGFFFNENLSRGKNKNNPHCTWMSFPDLRQSNDSKHDKRIVYCAAENGNCFFDCVGYVFGMSGEKVRSIFTHHFSTSIKLYSHPVISLWNYAVLLSTDGFYAGKLELDILSNLADCEVIVENYFKIGRGKTNRIVLQYDEDLSHFNLISSQVDMNTLSNFRNLESKFLLPKTALFGKRCKSCGEKFHKSVDKDFKVAHYSICCKSPEDGIKHIAKYSY